MKSLILILSVFALFGCNQSNPTTCYTVRYEATGNDDYYLFGIQNSTGGQDAHVLNANQNWSYEFEACTGHLVGLSIDGDYGLQPTTSSFSLKIYLNGDLWKEANGSPDIGIQAFLP
jgi:hypothetical protein